MANEINITQRIGNGPRIRRRITPTANQTLGFDATGKLVGKTPKNLSVTASADGAITIAADTTVYITKGSAAALTLAAPTASTHDGYTMTIVSTTAFAHTVTQTTPGFNNGSAASDVATYGAAVGNFMQIRAYNGIWYVLATKNVTLA